MSTIAHVSPPVTVKQMRSFTGSVKQMKDNIKDYHLLLHPLEKVDNATGLVKLVGDSQLERYKIKIETGRKNNKDSNPVAEKTVKEFREQQLKFKPQGGVITELEKTIITASLNKMIRNRNLSSKEIVTNRNQNTQEPLNLCDKVLARDQFELRQQNHPLSEKSKVRGGKLALKTNVWPGALVFLKKDKSKLRARETYIVVKVEEQFCFIKKLKNIIRSENYKVKLTEISLLPNQNDDSAEVELEEEVNKESDDEENNLDAEYSENEEDKNSKIIKENDAKIPIYNTRNKPKVDYKKLNEGNLAFVNKKPASHKLVYAWDTPENSDEEEPFIKPKLQFEIWCENSMHSCQEI